VFTVIVGSCFLLFLHQWERWVNFFFFFFYKTFVFFSLIKYMVRFSLFWATSLSSRCVMCLSFQRIRKRSLEKFSYHDSAIVCAVSSRVASRRQSVAILIIAKWINCFSWFPFSLFVNWIFMYLFLDSALPVSINWEYFSRFTVLASSVFLLQHHFVFENHIPYFIYLLLLDKKPI